MSTDKRIKNLWKSLQNSIKLIGSSWFGNYYPQITPVESPAAGGRQMRHSTGQAQINPKLARKAFGDGRIAAKLRWTRLQKQGLSR